jgi:hypothetical protein
MYEDDYDIMMPSIESQQRYGNIVDDAYDAFSVTEEYDELFGETGESSNYKNII